MNWANKITLLRIILIPIVLVLMFLDEKHHGLIDIKIGSSYEISLVMILAGIIFIIASLSDFLDGYIARHHNQVTTFGKFFDTIADKLLTNLVLVMFGYLNVIPIWAVLIFVARDFIMDVIRQVMSSQKVIVPANKLGKIKAAVQMIGLSILFFANCKILSIDIYSFTSQMLLIPTYIAILLSITSLINYIYLNRKGLLDTSTRKHD
ncbi:CDP-diacylglycerol--glycerol-3-phosphate 3-phosphatidyltransferase [Spiroplasma endosymbiont of Crioceris asparagi]|uniref:CDP-diacylglycerol--glycerol-3-phosphate 3-phosphatidyltransferase n=1 Tax=Spiroplasma endosymbiont of Crioceris asparagi TaxID=3066286 RepID=UPI0030CCB835